MTVVAVNRELRARGFWGDARPEPDLLGALDLVALGTVADVVPLKGLNRAFVAKGLLAMRRRENPGLTALMDIARLGGPPEPWHLGFLLGPRINAGGRIGRATLGVELLGEDPSNAHARRRTRPPQSRASGDRNRNGRAGGSRSDGGARGRGKGRGRRHSVGRLACGRGRNVAAASRRNSAGPLLRSRLNLAASAPVRAARLRGRCRSSRARGGARRLLIKGGGHAMAAGVTLRKDALAAFRAFSKQAGAAVGAARSADALLIDGALSAAGADARGGGHPGADGTIRRGQSGAGVRAAGPHDGLCG